jgi:hypothetical protein
MRLALDSIVYIFKVFLRCIDFHQVNSYFFSFFYEQFPIVHAKFYFLSVNIDSKIVLFRVSLDFFSTMIYNSRKLIGLFLPDIL